MIKQNQTRGSIIAIVFITVTVLLLVGVSFIFWLRIESRSATSKRKATKDVFYAELGKEKIVHRIQTDATFKNSLVGANSTFFIIIDTVTIRVDVQGIP